jgi:uncharacterized membrane protein
MGSLIMAILTLFFLGLFIVSGLLLIGVSIPLILRRVKPNRIYGFRTTKTLSDERIWYEANAYAGRMFLRTGSIFTISAIALYFILRPDFIAFNFACLAILLSTLAIHAWLCYRYLRTL